MCNECDATKGWKFCPHCGAELKQETKSPMTQEEFDKIFLGILKDARKVVWLTPNGNESELPTCKFELRNSKDEWMFDIDLNSDEPHFWFSTIRVQKLFSDKYGLQYKDIQVLMKKQLAELFKLNDVTVHSFGPPLQ